VQTPKDEAQVLGTEVWMDAVLFRHAPKGKGGRGDRKKGVARAFERKESLGRLKFVGKRGIRGSPSEKGGKQNNLSDLKRLRASREERS